MFIEEHLCVRLLIKSNSQSCCIIHDHILISRVFQVLATIKRSIPKCSLNSDILIWRCRHRGNKFEVRRWEDLAFPWVDSESFVSLISFCFGKHADALHGGGRSVFICIVDIFLSLLLNLISFFLVIYKFPLKCR